MISREGMETALLLMQLRETLNLAIGAGRLLPNPHLLVRPYVAREAVASSRIRRRSGVWSIAWLRYRQVDAWIPIALQAFR